MEVEQRSWGWSNSSVGKALAIQAQKCEFGSQNTYENARHGGTHL